MSITSAINIGMKSTVKCSKHGASLGNVSAPNSFESGRKERKERKSNNNS